MGLGFRTRKGLPEASRCQSISSETIFSAQALRDISWGLGGIRERREHRVPSETQGILRDDSEKFAGRCRQGFSNTGARGSSVCVSDVAGFNPLPLILTPPSPPYPLRLNTPKYYDVPQWRVFSIKQGGEFQIRWRGLTFSFQVLGSV